ncbi:MAG: tetratricopeptide repeat protein [Bacteroidales bacterium]|nr:tetratricopeptide repeat protein [Bacteroidales bacterium]
MQRLITYLFFILSPYFLMGESLLQQPIKNVDSLRNCLSTAKGTAKVDILNKLCYSLYKTSPKEAITYAKQALSLSDSLNYNLGKLNAHHLLAYQSNPEYVIEKAIKHLQISEQYFDSKSNWYQKHRIWLGLGNRYSIIKKYDSAIIYFHKSLSLLNDDKKILYSFNIHYKLAIIYNLSGEYNKEIEKLNELYKLLISQYEIISKKPNSTKFTYLEKPGGYYTRHGYYAKSIESNNRVLENINKYDLSPFENNYYTAKFLGHIGRAYYHWGKYKLALKYHNKSLKKFYQSEEIYNELIKEKIKTYINDCQINIANQIEGKANVQMYLGLYEKAELNFQHSLRLREEKGDTPGVATCRDGLGELYQIQGKFTKSLEQFETSIKLNLSFLKNFIKAKGMVNANHIKVMINESISITYLRKGNLFYDWNKLDLALEQYNKSLELCRNIGYIKGEAEALTAIGDICLQQNKNDSALINYQKVLKLYQKIDNRPGIGFAYHKQGNYYVKIKQAEKALDYYSKALVILEEIDLQKDIAEIYEKRGSIYFNEGRYPLALDEFNKCINIATSLNCKKIMMKAHKGASEVYTILGNTSKAFSHYKKYISAKDSIYTIESQKQIAEIETKYETTKNEKHIELLEKENELKEMEINQNRLFLFALLGFVLLIIIVAYLIIKQNKIKSEQKTIQVEQKLLRSQMNPHFIFNSLSSIQNFIVNEKPHKANKYLSRFAKLVRSILDYSFVEFVQLDDEINTINYYLELQKIRFPKKFDYFIEVDDEIDTEGIKIPPMLAQPFIENSIEHGMKSKKTKGNINISFKLKDDILIYSIEDDGIGRKKAHEILQKQDKGHKSLATVITLERISILNKKLKKKIELEIVDLKDEKGKAKGTKVIFQLPIIS